MTLVEFKNYHKRPKGDIITISKGGNIYFNSAFINKNKVTADRASLYYDKSNKNIFAIEFKNDGQYSLIKRNFGKNPYISANRFFKAIGAKFTHTEHFGYKIKDGIFCVDLTKGEF